MKIIPWILDDYSPQLQRPFFSLVNFMDSGCIQLLIDEELFVDEILVNGESCNVLGAVCDALEGCFGPMAVCVEVEPCS